MRQEPSSEPTSTSAVQVTASCELSTVRSPCSTFLARVQVLARAPSLFATIRPTRSPAGRLTRAVCLMGSYEPLKRSNAVNQDFCPTVVSFEPDKLRL